MDKIINNSLSNEHFNLFAAILLTLLIGNTIKPVPPVLENLFNTSFLFNYVILVAFITRAFYPVTNQKLILILVFSFVLLYSLKILRMY